MKSDDTPRILLVEDDPVARAFLTAAVEAIGVRVDGAGSVAEALVCAGQYGHDAWLVDANLPDGHGEALLAMLKREHPRTPAIAHTASNVRDDLDALLRAGFDEVLVKPLPARAVAEAVRRALKLPGPTEPGMPRGATSAGKLPVWDDDNAARAMGGNMDHVAALRDLFLVELPGARQRILQAGREAQAAVVLDELHRLRASCGFVGASRLAAAVVELRADATATEALAHFDHVVEDTLATPPIHLRATAAPPAFG